MNPPSRAALFPFATMMINMMDSLARYKQPITDATAAAFDEFVAQLPERSKDVEWAFEALKSYSLRPSKKIRGSLAASLYDHSVGADMDPDGLKLAAAIELVQNYLLIVDDVMDRSPLRRGKPTIHELYKKQYDSASEHESNMAGILIGVLAQHVTNDIILRLPVAADWKTKAISVIQVNIATTDMGQIDDMQQQIYRLPISRDELLRKYQQKSSYYSFVNPLESALALAGKWTQQSQNDCLAFGIPAGVAFQLRDDYIGIFGDTSSTGKANLEDVREGKYTFMVHYALEGANDEQRSTLLGILGRSDASENDLETVRAILNKTGAVDKAMADARMYADEAIAAATKANAWQSDFTELLASMVNFSVERTL